MLAVLALVWFVLAPAAAAWLAASARAPSTPRALLAVFLPAPLGGLALLLAWASRYRGLCGDGERYACSFAEYLVEALLVGTLSILSPAALGVLLGLLTWGLFALRALRR